MSHPAHSPSAPDASHVLVAGPPIRAARYEPCRSLLMAGESTPDVVSVTYRQPIPEPFADVASGSLDGTPRVSVVDVGPDEPGTALQRRIDELPVETTITSVAATESLTELGMTIEGRLQDSAADARPVGLCFDSLTALCLYAGPAQADRFLGWLRSRIDTVDGRAHYHADPAAHEVPPRERFGSHFDDVIEVRSEDQVEPTP